MSLEEIVKEEKVRREAIRERIRRGGAGGLKLYIERIFKEVYNREFEFYWYHDLIILVLWNVIIGKEKRVIFEMGPRTGKTELIVRIFISFIQGYFQFIKNQYVTYGAELTDDTSGDINNIMESEEYQKIFPKVKFSDKQNKKSNWKLVSGTEFFGSSVGGAITGKGSHFTVLDDTLKAHNADSKAERDNAWKFIQSSVFTRMEEDGAVIEVMQRLHEDDPTGRFIKNEGLKKDGGEWACFTFPYECHEDTVYEYEDFYYFRKAGEILPNRNHRTEESIRKLKRSIGTIEFEKQYNQNVTVAETGYFNKDDITEITNIDLPDENLYISVDSAESLEAVADDRAIGVIGWSINDDEIEQQTIHDGKRGIWDVYGVCEHLIELMIKYPKAAVYIEGAGGGITLGVVLNKEIAKANAKLRALGKPSINNSINMYPPKNKISKQTKIKYMKAPYENHTIKVHKGCDLDFRKQYEKELLMFNPEKKQQKDNCIDCIASTWLWAVAKKNSIKKKINQNKSKSKKGWRGI
jgi:hypothetical protein